ncbi:hypothetical protein [Dactylosporangium darangshiense]|uniref:hypothetical protein n=1 Tax=Dactylosporangium darangshiense TaxID=579108 RepID=UPI00362A1C98
MLPAAYLLGAGLIIGLIATLRISPVGPIVAGLALLGTYVSLFIDPISVFNSLDPIDMGFATADLRVPVTNGTTAVLGLALLVAAASVKRWRPWPTAVALPAAGGPETSDVHEYPLGHGPTPPRPVAARPPTARCRPARPRCSRPRPLRCCRSPGVTRSPPTRRSRCRRRPVRPLAAGIRRSRRRSFPGGRSSPGRPLP